MQLSKPPKPKATRKRLKKEILSDDFNKRKIVWKNIAENCLENFPYGKIFHLTSLVYSMCEWTSFRKSSKLTACA
jgi:predicted secreted acid phosphatase